MSTMMLEEGMISSDDDSELTLYIPISNSVLDVSIIDIYEHRIAIKVDSKVLANIENLTTGHSFECNLAIENVPNRTLNLKLNKNHDCEVISKSGVVYLEAADIDAEIVISNAKYLLHQIRNRTKHSPMHGLHRSDLIPRRGQFTEDARLARVEYIQKKTNFKLDSLSNTKIEASELVGNLEAFIGAVEIPIGLAGPLHITGEYANGTYYAPLATTEGALIDSVTRGSMAISKCGSVNVKVIGQRMVRAPVFIFDHLDGAVCFVQWLEHCFDSIRSEAKKYSNHAELIELIPYTNGKAVHVQFVFQTGDASGQNISTTCTWNTCQWILLHWNNSSRYPIRDYFIEANLSGDKKVTNSSFSRGRGLRVTAEANITESVLNSVLRTTSDLIHKNYQHVVVGAAQAGMIGMNINIANIIAALFVSLGQDIACTHESSTGQFYLEKSKDGIYISTVLPNLIVGTVGGGTGLATQKEALKILGCYGTGKSYKLAEIFASFALALDLSTLAAVSSGRFAAAHERLGKNRLVNYLKAGELNDRFFSDMLRKQLNRHEVTVTKIVETDKKIDNSIITEFTSSRVKKQIGFKTLNLTVQYSPKHIETHDVLLKIKATDSDVIHMVNSVAAYCNPRIAEILRRIDGATGFKQCDKRELAIYRCSDERFTKITPKIFGIYKNSTREIYLILMEYLQNTHLFNSADHISLWSDQYIDCAICDISSFHSIWYKRVDQLRNEDWIGTYPTAKFMKSLDELWNLLFQHAVDEFREWWSDDDITRMQTLIDKIPFWWNILDSMDKTLIHGDFNPRNICFRTINGNYRLCAYDWELSTIHLPQRDLVELLAFVLTKETISLKVMKDWAEIHRVQLQNESKTNIDKDIWWQGFCYSFFDFAVNRLLHYVMAHTVKYYEFMERVVATTLKAIEELGKDLAFY